MSQVIRDYSIHIRIRVPIRNMHSYLIFPISVYLAIEIWTVARCNVEGESEAFLRRCNTVSYLIETDPNLEFVEAQASCGSKSRTVGIYELLITSFWIWKATTLFFESIELGIDRDFQSRETHLRSLQHR